MKKLIKQAALISIFVVVLASVFESSGAIELSILINPMIILYFFIDFFDDFYFWITMLKLLPFIFVYYLGFIAILKIAITGLKAKNNFATKLAFFVLLLLPFVVHILLVWLPLSAVALA